MFNNIKIIKIQIIGLLLKTSQKINLLNLRKKLITFLFTENRFSIFLRKQNQEISRDLIGELIGVDELHLILVLFDDSRRQLDLNFRKLQVVENDDKGSHGDQDTSNDLVLQRTFLPNDVEKTDPQQVTSYQNLEAWGPRRKLPILKSKFVQTG